jgi:hypothetical protein
VLSKDLGHYDTRSLKALMAVVRADTLVRAVQRRGHDDKRILLALEQHPLANELERQFRDAGFTLAWANEPATYREALTNGEVAAVVVEATLDELIARRLMMAIGGEPDGGAVEVFVLVEADAVIPAYFGDRVQQIAPPFDSSALTSGLLQAFGKSTAARQVLGRLEDLAADLLVSMLCAQRGRVRIDLGPSLAPDQHDPDSGHLLLDNGRVVEVILGADRADRALTRLLARKSGIFEVEFDGAPFTLTLNAPDQ